MRTRPIVFLEAVLAQAGRDDPAGRQLQPLLDEAAVAIMDQASRLQLLLGGDAWPGQPGRGLMQPPRQSFGDRRVGRIGGDELADLFQAAMSIRQPDQRIGGRRMLERDVELAEGRRHPQQHLGRRSKAGRDVDLEAGIDERGSVRRPVFQPEIAACRSGRPALQPLVLPKRVGCGADRIFSAHRTACGRLPRPFRAAPRSLAALAHQVARRAMRCRHRASSRDRPRPRP